MIDTQARPVADDLALLAAACDLLILPTTPDILALDALALMVQHLAGLPIAPYRILLTMIPPYPSRAGAEVRAMLTTTGLPLLEGGIRRYAVFQKAAVAGTVVYDVKGPKAELGWQDYVAILGMGGIGKSSLATRRAAGTIGSFECMIWRSLRNGPPLETLMEELVPLSPNSRTPSSPWSRSPSFSGW